MIHTYRYKKPKDNWFWLTGSLLLLSFTIYITLVVLLFEPTNVVAMILPVIFGFMGCILLKVYFTRRQYHKIDNGKEIIIDNKLKQLSVSDASVKNFLITPDDIFKVTYYESWNSLPLFSMLGYIEIELYNHNKIHITKFTIDAMTLRTILRGKPYVRITKLMNSLN